MLSRNVDFAAHLTDADLHGNPASALRRWFSSFAAICGVQPHGTTILPSPIGNPAGT